MIAGFRIVVVVDSARQEERGWLFRMLDTYSHGPEAAYKPPYTHTDQNKRNTLSFIKLHPLSLLVTYFYRRWFTDRKFRIGEITMLVKKDEFYSLINSIFIFVSHFDIYSRRW